MALAPYPQPLATCKFARTTHHALGAFCLECRAIAMPFGTELPWAADALGFPIADPTRGAILEGLYLHPSGVVAVAILAFCKMNNQDYENFANASSRLSEPLIQAIATRIVEIADFLAKVKTAKPKPKWYHVLADTMAEPNVTIDQYIRKIVGGSKIEVMEYYGSPSDSSGVNIRDSDDTEGEDELEDLPVRSNGEALGCFGSLTLNQQPVIMPSSSPLSAPLSTPKTPTPKSTPTLKLMSAPQTSPLQKRSTIQAKKRKADEMAQSESESDSEVDTTMEEGTTAAMEKETPVKRNPGERKKRCVRAGTRTGMASPISKSRVFKEIRETPWVPELRFNHLPPKPQSVSPTSSDDNPRDSSFAGMQLSFL